MTNITSPKMVYFMRRIDDTGPVKIGCSRDVEKRVKSLSCTLKTPLKVLAVVEGAQQLENWLHRHFYNEAVSREWFEMTPRLEAMISDIKNGCFAEPIGAYRKDRFRVEAGVKSAATERLRWDQYKAKVHALHAAKLSSSASQVPASHPPASV